LACGAAYKAPRISDGAKALDHPETSLGPATKIATTFFAIFPEKEIA
jgi:hypothetical protein